MLQTIGYCQSWQEFKTRQKPKPKMANMNWPRFLDRRKLFFLCIFIAFVPDLSLESVSNSETPESISFAADAIGMYLKKIANKELFVLNMQEIFNLNFDSVQPPIKSEGMNNVIVKFHDDIKHLITSK